MYLVIYLGYALSRHETLIHQIQISHDATIFPVLLSSFFAVGFLSVEFSSTATWNLTCCFNMYIEFFSFVSQIPCLCFITNVN